MINLSTAVINKIREIETESQITQFKLLFAEACRESRNNESISEKLMEEIPKAFRETLKHANIILYNSNLSESDRDQLGNWLHSEFVAMSLLGTLPSRSLRKPQNIAGDHHTIKQIYSGGDQERRVIGHLVNLCFLNEPASKAVVNRMNYIKQVIYKGLENNSGEPFQVTSVASGPAEELFEVYSKIDNGDYPFERKNLVVRALDLDFRACSSVDDKIKYHKLQSYFKVLHTDITKKSTIAKLNQQDLVYSMGLIDYFKDNLCIKIINNIYDLLKPGGEIIIGNFHDTCPSRCFLDYILDWPLIYRSQEDMERLFLQSKFACKPTIDFEEERVNMLARATKH